MSLEKETQSKAAETSSDTKKVGDLESKERKTSFVILNRAVSVECSCRYADCYGVKDDESMMCLRSRFKTTFSSSLLIVRSFEIGRYEAGSDGSMVGFLRRGVTTADLKAMGKTHSEKHKLNRSERRRLNKGEHDFKPRIGITSASEDLFPSKETKRATISEVETGVNDDKKI